MGDSGAVPLMIVADTYQTARLYAREHELGREDQGWRYVWSPQQVRGRRGGQYVRIWSDDFLPSVALADRWDTIQALRMAGFTHVEDA